MPGVPMEMPSDTVMLLNSDVLGAGRGHAFGHAAASSSMCMLHGVTRLQVEAMPTCGRAKSASSKPTARSIARLGERSVPLTTMLEYLRLRELLMRVGA